MYIQLWNPAGDYSGGKRLTKGKGSGENRDMNKEVLQAGRIPYQQLKLQQMEKRWSSCTKPHNINLLITIENFVPNLYLLY